MRYSLRLNIVSGSVSHPSRILITLYLRTMRVPSTLLYIHFVWGARLMTTFPLVVSLGVAGNKQDGLGIPRGLL